MSDKINQQFFVDYIAEHHKMNKADAEKFVNAFFSVIEEALHTDSIVKIKGLGTFKLIDVESRESMNIHSGERFVIERYTKISFTPDASLRDIINRPFEHFETVLLKDGVTFSDVPEVEGDSDDDNTLDDEPETPSAETEVILHAEPEVSSSAEPEETHTGVVAPIVAAVPEVAATVEPEEIPVPESEDVPENGLEEIPVVESESSHTATEEPTADESEEATVAEPESEEIPVTDDSEAAVDEMVEEEASIDDPLQKLIAEAVEEKRKRENVVAGMYTKKHEEEVGEIHDDRRSGSGRGTKILINCVLCVVVLAVLVCGYYVAKMYFPELFDDDNMEYNADADSTIDDFRQIALVDTIIAPDTLAVDSLAADTLNEDSLNVAAEVLENKPEAKEVKPVAVKEVRVEKVVDNSKAASAVASTATAAVNSAAKTVDKSALNAPVHPDSVNYKVVGTKATHILQPGETLTRVSLKFYGTKDLYPYIVNYNRNVILDPNNVSVGTTLRIPELVKK